MSAVVVINPMRSARPTGIGIAGDAIADTVLKGAVLRDPRSDAWFRAINDGPLPGPTRALARLAVAQLVPRWQSPNARLLFTTHQSPLWKTGRHAVIVHDTIPLQYPDQARGQAFFFRKVLPRSLRCASRIVTVSATVRDELVRAGHSAAGEATVIPSYSPRLTRIPGRSWRARRESREIVVLGARFPHKNLGVVLDALGVLNAAGLNRPWQLTVLGVRPELWQAGENGLNRCLQRGWAKVEAYASDATVAAALERATMLVFPSLAEGQGLPPLEAMARGCPVICSDIPVLRETCAEAAMYFPPDDARGLAALLGSLAGGALDAQVARHIDAGVRRIETFSAQALASKWQAFLSQWA